MRRLSDIWHTWVHFSTGTWLHFSTGTSMHFSEGIFLHRTSGTWRREKSRIRGIRSKNLRNQTYVGTNLLGSGATTLLGHLLATLVRHLMARRISHLEEKRSWRINVSVQAEVLQNLKTRLPWCKRSGNPRCTWSLVPACKVQMYETSTHFLWKGFSIFCTCTSQLRSSGISS